MNGKPGPMKVPPPGLQGTYEGACAVCLKPTDTGLVFDGEAEWTIAGLVNMGVPEDQAFDAAILAWGTDPGMVPAGKIKTQVRVCAKDAVRAGCEVGLLVGDEVPPYQQREGLEES